MLKLLLTTPSRNVQYVSYAEEFFLHCVLKTGYGNLVCKNQKEGIWLAIIYAVLDGVKFDIIHA